MSVNRQLTKAVKTVVVSSGVTAGTTNANLTAVDTLGFSAYRIVAVLGTLTSTQVTKIKVQESPTNGNFADVTNAITNAANDADSGKMLILEVYKPQERWIQPVLLRGTANAVLASAVVELYLPDFQPTSSPTDTTNVSQYVTLDNPA